jgi:hypothetical protein
MAHDLQANTCRRGKHFSSRGRPLNRSVPNVTRAGLLACCLLLLPISAQTQEGQFEVRSGESLLESGVYYVSARLNYELSDEALEALKSGVALTFELHIELTRTRRFWIDPEIANLVQSYELQYHALSDRYIVKNLNSGGQNTFATLFSALNTMGRVADLPIIDAALLDPDATYNVRIRAVLDQDRLPGPLRLFALWQDGFKLESDWYGWSLSE